LLDAFASQVQVSLSGGEKMSQSEQSVEVKAIRVITVEVINPSGVTRAAKFLFSQQHMNGAGSAIPPRREDPTEKRGWPGGRSRFLHPLCPYNNSARNVH